MRSKNHFAINLILAVIIALSVSCRGTGVMKVAEFSEHDQSLPRTIILVNWNVQKGASPQFVDDLARLLEQEQPDIVFLQEARTGLIQVEQMGGYFANGWSYPWPGGTMVGVLTLSRIPPVQVEPVSTRYREFFVTAPKVSLLTEYPLPSGKSLLTVNVHLLNFERWGDLKIRDQLADLKSLMIIHPGPIIMAGDFNTWNEKRLQLVEEIVGELKLAEVIDFPAGRTTGDLGSDFFNTIFGIQTELSLDRVYYRGFSIDSARVLPYESSDHKPIAVRLTLN
jgi:endonuclease/exonuclease/phosphatase (EEP) superfamily protein YafD